MTHARLSLGLAALLASAPTLATAATPAPVGTETTVIAGHSLSEYQSNGAGPVYRYVSSGLTLHLASRTRFDNNLTIVAQLDGDHGIVQGFQQMTPDTGGAYEPAANHVGDTLWQGAAAMRAGWHNDFLGGELGMALTRFPTQERILHPSGMVWLGKPDVLYLWGSTMAGPITRSQVLTEPFAGVGHRGDKLSAWWGTHVASRISTLPWRYLPADNPVGSQDVSTTAIPWIAGAAFEVADGVRLGFEYGIGDGQAAQTVPDTRVSMVVKVEGAEYDAQ